MDFRQLSILPQRTEQIDSKYKDISIESDWSSASYWYNIVANSPAGTEITLQNLTLNSAQGDAIVSKIYTAFGVKSNQISTTQIQVIKTAKELPSQFQYNFRSVPDLAQTIIPFCAINKIPGKFSGLETLKIKETNRIEALQNECAKFGAILKEQNNGIYHLLFIPNFKVSFEIEIDTYDDHRMALGFSSNTLYDTTLLINNQNVIGKSYPTFWSHLQFVGFNIQTKVNEG